MIYPENTTSNNETLSIDENGVMRGKYLAQPTTIKVSISGLEKIEPLTGQFFILKQGDEIISREGGEDWRNQVVASKLNEVIEKMNLIMEYLNKGVKK
ncbi:MAG: hypothetical protein BWY21_01114 [Parcubacteria group bacterium ADurb.Bin216]|nr:MAG: hypothetical protein BWY21_01114 [Parcubacteria group bacterium ADurb.Bin216]